MRLRASRGRMLRHYLSATGRRPVDNASRSRAIEEKRRRITSGQAPLLARLPDVSAELPAPNPSPKSELPHKLGYRFDPPQASSRAGRTAEDDRTAPFRTLKSELVYAPHSTRPLHPHVFEKSWMKPIQSRLKPRESSILPRSSPFSTPRRSMAEVLTPYIQFLTLVALFAAAGVWVQANNKSHANKDRSQSPETATQQSDNAPTKTVDRPVHNPTAIGPVTTTPENSVRLGRVRSSNDFARLSGDILPIGPSEAATMEAVSAPNSTPAAGTALPQVQMAEAISASQANVGASTAYPTQAAAATSPPMQQVPEVATRTAPGFSIQIPSR